MSDPLALLELRVLGALASDSEITEVTYPSPRRCPMCVGGSIFWVNVKGLGLEFTSYTEHSRDGVIVKCTYQFEGSEDLVTVEVM